MEWADFLPHVLPYVQGCPDELAIDHVRKAARTFCARTLAWNMETEPTLTVVAQSVYPLDLDEDQERVKVVAAWVDGSEVEVIDPANGRRRVRNGDGGAFIYMDTALDFVVNPVPTVADQEMYFHLAVKPSLTAQAWPDELAEHAADIAHGAIYSLCLIPRQDWTDNKQAVAQLEMFTARINTVAFNALKGFAKTAQRSRVNYF